MQEMWVLSVGGEDLLEEIATHPIIFFFTPLFLPGKLHGQSILGGYSLWGRKELNMTEQLTNNILREWGAAVGYGVAFLALPTLCLESPLLYSLE